MWGPTHCFIIAPPTHSGGVLKMMLVVVLMVVVDTECPQKQWVPPRFRL